MVRDQRHAEFLFCWGCWWECLWQQMFLGSCMMPCKQKRHLYGSSTFHLVVFGVSNRGIICSLLGWWEDWALGKSMCYSMKTVNILNAKCQKSFKKWKSNMLLPLRFKTQHFTVQDKEKGNPTLERNTRKPIKVTWEPINAFNFSLLSYYFVLYSIWFLTCLKKKTKVRVKHL